ncbi:transport and Golgi organization protein 2 homolog [Limulus polyphemus]|uniref:Transport and Golgi organization protein 2 homolog n=1 Tax=Limulus polyphemus TaxID=6850 RepID=A0ABM1BNJ3_LIMPO|nr:transport and Golgi organization protein 2 homolog [Limulus polyphemus]
MCMLFLYLNPNPTPDGYLMIVANVRDEFYYRPTLPCHVWNQDPRIVGGMDIEEGRKGGTWFAISNTGRLAALLNLMKPLSEMTEKKLNRGFLSVQCLQSPKDPLKYLQQLQNEAHNYYDFLMVTAEVSPSNGVHAYCYCNCSEKPPVVLGPGIHVFGNNRPDKKWKKTEYGEKVFHHVISRNKTKDSLLKELFAMLQDETLHYPDSQLENDAAGVFPDAINKLSSIFVKIPDSLFGSRTHSIVLVDAKGNVDFVESNMPDNGWITTGLEDFSDPKYWLTSRIQFPIQDNSQFISKL